MARSPWGSLWIANLVTFLGAVQFSVYFSSLWPYLQEIDTDTEYREDGRQASFFGWIMAGYSIGEMVSSPLFGYASNRMRNTKIPVAVGLVILTISNFILVLIESLPAANRKWALLSSRILLGIGAGNASPLKAYVATASTLQDRSTAIILSTAAYTLGFMLGPG